MSEFSVVHFDFKENDSTSPVKAAGWAWKCLENLCSCFCINFCQKTTNCNEGQNFGLDNEANIEDLQKTFHRALSYLKAIKMNEDECSACIVTKALQTFPLIASKSAVSPVSEVKMNAIDCHPEVVPMGSSAEMSFPCCVITTWLGESEYSTENRCREMAILNLDVEDLPSMPPWEYDRIEKAFLLGQVIVNKIWAIKEGKLDEGLDKTALFQMNIENAVAATICLRDLLRIRYYFPNAVPDNDFKQLSDTLTDWIDQSVQNEPLLKRIYDKFFRPDSTEKESILDLLSMFYSALMLHHPDIPSYINDSELSKGTLEKIMYKCVEESTQPVKNACDYITNVKIKKCIYPTPENQQDYQSVSRYFMMFREYWLICHTALTNRISNDAEFTPYPLSALIGNLKNRIDYCLKGMVDKGIKISPEIQKALNYLIEALIQWDVDEFSLGSDDFKKRVQQLSSWCDEEYIKHGPCLTGVISEEETVIDFARQQIAKHNYEVQAMSKTMLGASNKQKQEAEMKPKSAPQKNNATTSFPLPDSASWEELSIIFLDGHVVSVGHRETKKRFNYTQMGMVNNKNSEPNKQWELLRTFAEHHGQLDWHSKHASTSLKKQKQELSKRLREFFHIKDDPIEWVIGEKSYRCKFTLLFEDPDGY